MELCFLVLFGDCGNLIFDKKVFQSLTFMFSFYPENSRTRRKLPDHSLSNAFNLLLIGLPYTLSFEWPDFELKYLVTVTQKGQPPKFRASVWNYSISQTNSKCNSLFRHAGSNWVIIIMELKRKVEYCWECTFWAS